MTVSNGRQFLCIPGPTTVPESVLNAAHQPAVDIYAGDLIALTDRCLMDLRTVFCTQGRSYIYAANGHGAWEAALSNVLSRGDRILVLESGRFAHGWGEMAAMLGITVDRIPGDWRRAVDPAALEARLRDDKSGEIKAVLVVQVDTASGVVNDIPAIREAIDAAGHDALLMVDVVASLAVVPFEMDAWGVDVAVAASQKGLMMMPGLSFVAAGQRAQGAHQRANLRSRYWDWTARDGDEHYMKYCGTPPEHLLFALRKSLDLLFDEGMDCVYQRHALLACAVRHAVACWTEGNALAFNIIADRERADAVTTIVTNGDRSPNQLLEYCREKCGVVLGIGIGDLNGRAFRIAHMGHVNAPMILGALSAVEIGLAALEIPHGRGGVQAAIDALARLVPA